MYNAFKKLLLVMILCVLMLASLPTTAMANSAEPPSLVILIKNPPEDLSIRMLSSINNIEAKVKRVAWEGYYAFYSRDMQTSRQYTLEITTNGESFQCTLDAPLQHYNNVATLDIVNRELTSGKYPFRSALLVLIRVLLTLLLEGIIFWSFNFRQKKSWIIFLSVNLITQGVLNVLLNSGGSLMPSYLIFELIVGEIFVFTTEMIAIPLLVKEHRRSRTLCYTIVANFVSLVAGGFIITALPV